MDFADSLRNFENLKYLDFSFNVQEGFDPSSDEYYAEGDRRMRQEMPHKFQEQKPSAQPVAPASNGRSSSKTGRKKTVQLSPAHVESARRLGVPLERMAQEVAKFERKAT